MPAAPFRSLLVACLLLAPLGAASTEDTRLSSEDECKVTLTTVTFPAGCALHSTATIAVTGCMDAGCTLLVDAVATGTADLPGLLSAETILVVSNSPTASICLGPKAVSDELPLPCTRLCESRDVGTQTVCEAEFETSMNLPRGSCTMIDAVSSLHYDWMAADALTSLTWQACRANNDQITITALG